MPENDPVAWAIDKSSKPAVLASAGRVVLPGWCLSLHPTILTLLTLLEGALRVEAVLGPDVDPCPPHQAKRTIPVASVAMPKKRLRREVLLVVSRRSMVFFLCNTRHPYVKTTWICWYLKIDCKFWGKGARVGRWCISVAPVRPVVDSLRWAVAIGQIVCQI